MNRSAHYTVGAALSEAWLTQLQEMRACENGVIAGNDAEALHRFRVALRKTRALLREFRAYLPEHRAMADELSWLSDSLNRARDLDIIEQFIRNLSSPPTLNERRAQTACLRELKRERSTQQKSLKALLQSSRYRKLIKAWKNFSERVSIEASQLATLSISIETAQRVLALGQCIQLLRRLREIDASSASSQLHRLRIRCKRLRYLFEALPQLSGNNSSEVDSVVKILKRLQTVLGEHQDTVVIRAWLLQFVNSNRGFALPPAWMEDVDRQYCGTLSALPGVWRRFLDVSKKI